MKLFSESCRIVSKKEVVLQKGERAGEVVFRVGISDGESVLNDLQADISSEVFSELVCFEKLYSIVFEYQQRSFNGRSYTTFTVCSITE